VIAPGCDCGCRWWWLSSSARSVVPPLDARCRMIAASIALSFPAGFSSTLAHFLRVWAGCSFTSRGLQLDARSFPAGFSSTLSHFLRVWAGCSFTSRGLGGRFDGGGWVWVCPAAVRWLGCVMGFTGGWCWGFGLVWGCCGVVFLVFAGVLGGVGLDLVWGLGACKVIRVAAADAER
jgi:hypothetical protein